jgi:hypothetical protein
MEHLLAGGGSHDHPILTDLAPGLSAAVVVTPEYAFGHEDWAELDALVRQQQRPLVLVAGFGATILEKVQTWAGQVGDTARLLSWDAASAQLSPARPINGVWCWIHGFGLDTACIVVLKNHMEQSTELVALDWIQPGSNLLHLAFQDLDLFPLICADMVQTFADGPGTAVHRVQSALQLDPAPAKPVLLTGSLLQGTPSNPNWAIAIESWLNHVTLGRPALLALANVSVDQPVFEEAQDAWRSLTGVFSRMSAIPKNQRNLRVTRGVAPQNARGAVLRTTAPYAAAGPLAWPPYVPTGEQFFWDASMGVPLSGAGIPAPVRRPPEVDCLELARFTRRVPAQPGWCPRVQAGLTAIRAHVESGAAPKARELLTGLLKGVHGEARCSADEVAKEPNGVALTQGLHSLATLVSETDHFSWKASAGEVGQLVLTGVEANVLVWRDPALSGQQIRHALGAWAQEPEKHPPLVVLAAGPHGQVEEGHIGHPRDNITAGPDSEAELSLGGGLATHATDITERRTVRSVACIGLQRVTDLFVDYDAAQDAARMAAFVDRRSHQEAPAGAAGRDGGGRPPGEDP